MVCEGCEIYRRVGRKFKDKEYKAPRGHMNAVVRMLEEMPTNPRHNFVCLGEPWDIAIAKQGGEILFKFSHDRGDPRWAGRSTYTQDLLFKRLNVNDVEVNAGLDSLRDFMSQFHVEEKVFREIRDSLLRYQCGPGM